MCNATTKSKFTKMHGDDGSEVIEKKRCFRLTKLVNFG